jgi:hypothetical protein
MCGTPAYQRPVRNNRLESISLYTLHDTLSSISRPRALEYSDHAYTLARKAHAKSGQIETL